MSEANLALILLMRNNGGDLQRAIGLLRAAHGSAREMGIPEAGQIARILKQDGG